MADAGDQVRGRLVDDVHHPFPSGGGWLQGFLGSFGGLLLLLLLLGLEKEEGFLLLLLLLLLGLEEGILLLGLEEESFLLLLLLLLLLGLLEKEGFLLLLLLLGLEEEELLVELLLLLGLVLLLVLQGVWGGAWRSWLDRRSRLHVLDDLDGW